MNGLLASEDEKTGDAAKDSAAAEEGKDENQA